MKRPDTSEYATFYERYIALTRGANHLALLRDSCESLLNTLAGVSEDLANKAYAPGKWTLKELLQHLVDTDAIFTYRALCISRGETTALPGFDHDAYVQSSEANNRSLAAILEDFKNLRAYITGLYGAMSEDQLNHIGSMNGNPASARALAFIIAGHCFHHLNIIKTRYLCA